MVGCSPEGIGIAANLLNAALYAFVNHDYGMASLSLLAGVTLGASKVVAMGGKLAKAVKAVETAGKFVSNVSSFAICTSQAVDIGSEMWQKYCKLYHYNNLPRNSRKRTHGHMVCDMRKKTEGS